MIKVRLADRSDFAGIIQLMQGYFLESTYGSHVDLEVDEAHASKIMFAALHAGYIWIATDELQVVGVLAVVREPNIWFPSKMSLRELFWYVAKEYRTSMAPGRLFVAYRTLAQDQLNKGNIQAYFMTEMATTPGLNLESRGFRLAERLYIKD